MIWLYPTNDTYSIWYIKPDLPGLIEIKELPPGDGILKLDHEGKPYWKPFPTPAPEPVPEKPVSPLDKMDDTIAELMRQLNEQRIQNLAILDVNMTIYDELMSVQAKLENTNGGN